eukprot:Blabericola_migrator_1__7964@NODE_4085_length_1339_cov_404_020440_g2522_i0_p1_GENE_NODE_4085_length_1339_cov_404_020440_g2522_i0NODE_4085_length_1339_cov_404_020440_g2522_i0_p1_ORF_typecomplete_len303_score9_18DHHC/PF01529_20/9_9e02DHHC/PF01529_20/9_4e34UPF0121/PF03661_13/8_2e02UPF0121/PF03661_13/0_61_NODE_4085_length_1339_cov_404_020440_g2522_i03961304
MSCARSLTAGTRLCRLLLWPVTKIVAPVARALLYIIDNAVRFLGPCLILLAFTLVTLFAAEVLYIRGRDFLKLPLGPLAFLLAIYVGCNVLLAYYHIVTTGPGHPPIISPREPSQYQICHRCIPCRLRIPRVHHCSACKQCIKRLDHHCPWVNGCVGEENYHYFIVFLVWAILGSTYTWVALLKPFWLAIVRELDDDYGDQFSDTAKDLLTLSFALSAALSLAVAALLALHLFLVRRNRTTLEFYLEIDVDDRLPTIKQTLIRTGVFSWPRFLWAGRATGPLGAALIPDMLDEPELRGIQLV